MNRRRLRALAVRYLKGCGIETRDWKGLDPRRQHFACGCSILRPAFKAYRDAVTFNPGFRSRVCNQHRGALGSGREL